MSGRIERLSSALRVEVSDVVSREVKDPRVHAAGLLTVTRVDLSSDFHSARVFVSFSGSESQGKAAVEGLSHAVGFIRGEIARRLTLRRAPELKFIHDRTSDHLAKIDALLREDPPK